MTNITKSLHEQKIEATAQELLDKGYKVVINPSQSDLPFDLGGYRPNLVATQNGKGVILEVKTSLKRVSVDRFQEIAEQIATHDGWRFILVTLDDAREKVLPSDEKELPSWSELISRLSKLDILLQESLFEPALLFLWSIIEAALRKRAIAQLIPIERFPPINLLNHMYSSGEISIPEFDLIKDCLERRNKVAHGILTSIDSDVLKLSTDVTRLLIEKWGIEHV